jgi:hypothetical protein
MCARKEIEVEAKGKEKSDGHPATAMPDVTRIQPELPPIPVTQKLRHTHHGHMAGEVGRPAAAAAAGSMPRLHGSGSLM